MAEVMNQRADLYPIRTVSAITGINPVTLRAWERRYGLVRPRRTDTGHRVYSARDIDKINRAIVLVEKGHSISQVAAMLEVASHSAATPDAVSGNTWEDYRARMFAAISAFREDEVDEIYNEVLALFSFKVVQRQLLIPLLKHLGDRWQSGAGSVAEEHFFNFYLRNKLGARFHHQGYRNLGPLLVTACMPGESHETGPMLFSLAALESGYRMVSLGANMPLADLPMVSRRAGADALIVSGRMPPSREVMEVQLPAVVRRSAIPVFVGGEISVRFRDIIGAAEAIALGEDIDRALDILGERLGRSEDQSEALDD